MIRVSIQDTIIDIIEQIESDTSDTIIIDFPIGHPILHNYISLKILASKVGKKELILLTNDTIGRKIGKNLGIKYSTIKDGSFVEYQKTKTGILHHNYTFWQYFIYQISQYYKEILQVFRSNKHMHSLSQYSQKYGERKAIFYFVWILLGSICLFTGVYFLAISKTYIYIEPEKIIKTQSYNFIMKENYGNSILGNNKFINLKKESLTFHTSENYSTSGIEPSSSSRSQGTITLYNMFENEVSLKPNTRFQTEDGIVFTSSTWIKIPAGITDNFGEMNPGIAEIEIVANELDISGRYVGLRGNIGIDTKLILPGLDRTDQELLYGISKNNFSGGSDEYTRIVGENDIEISRELFIEKLKDDSFETIKNKIIKENIANNTKIKILGGPSSVFYTQQSVNFAGDTAVGDRIDSFSIYGNISIHVYTYDSENITQKFRVLINERLLEGVEQVHSINEDSLRMSEIIYTRPNEFEQKATFEIQATYFQDFGNDEGSYIRELISKIQGLPIIEAENILVNDTRIANAEIRVRPFFSRNVSNIAQNIIIKEQ